MPNWCEGSLKVRGKIENVKKFFLEGLKCYEYNYKNFSQTIDKEAIELKEDSKDEVWIRINKIAHISGTRRAFIENTDIELIPERGYTTTAVNVKQAWYMCAEEFLEIAKKYNIDIRLYGFERGGEFNQEIIIENGEIIKNDEIKFDDYVWECPMPELGG